MSGVERTVASGPWTSPIDAARIRLTAWQGLFDHARLTTGQTVLVHGAAGGVGSIAVQLAHEAGARVIATGRADDRDVVLA